MFELENVEFTLFYIMYFYHQLKLDFDKIYGAKSLTSHNWNLFFSNNWKYMMANINEKGKSFSKKVEKLKGL